MNKTVSKNKSKSKKVHKQTVTAQISVDLAERLEALASAENRSKSFYIQKALVSYLDDVAEDIKDVFEAEKRYKEFLKSGENGITFAEMKKKYA